MASGPAGAEFPRVFGRYLLLDRLSRGGMGEIYLARVGEIEGFQKPCIIKKILPQLAADQEFISRFVAEAQIAIKLQHANIAQVYEVGLVDGDYFLAIEFVDGRDLRRTINRAREDGKPIPAEVGLFVVREVASGLAYAHRRTDDDGLALGLVHCDVSPPNVLLGFEGEVKLIDFGIARSVSHISTAANVGFGKLGYMAPEQLGAFGGVVNRRTDIYAAGVLLFELLTGERPFDFRPEASSEEMLGEIMGGAPNVSDRTPSLGRRFDELVGLSLSPDPSDRYPSAEELRDSIQRQLVELAPTFSAERLGSYLQGLYAEEIKEDPANLLVTARAPDLRQYEKALDEARGHTVSFALASAWTSVPPRGRAPNAPGTSPPGAAIPDLDAAQIRPRSPVPRLAVLAGLTLLAVVAVMAARGSLDLTFGLPERAPALEPGIEPAAAPPQTARGATGRPGAGPSPAERRGPARANREGARAGVAAPPQPRDGTSPQPSFAALTRDGQAPSTGPRTAPQVRRPTARAPAPRARQAALTESFVEERYVSVRRRYQAFEAANGKRLADQWEQLNSWITTHRQDLRGIDQRLAAFEKMMRSP